MQTLKKCYEEISENKNRWSYYKNPIDINNKWIDDEEAYEFIKQYFDYAGKSNVFKDENIEKYQEDIEKRAGHTISTFLLGIKLAECFDLDILKRSETNIDFKYYWFLTCLYHDVGYIFENRNDSNHLCIVQRDGIKGLQDIFRIKNIHKKEFKTYSKDQVELYLKKRSEIKSKLDHGIVGGLLLYDKLRKQFEIAWKRRTDINDSRESFYIEDECNSRQLHLSNRHYEAYAKAADAIIAHNIWQNTLLSYYETDDATEKNIKKKIDFIGIENELCFILCLADTLEPIKRKITNLDLISINSLVGEKGFEIKINKNIYESVYKEIFTFDKWMKVNIGEQTINSDSIIRKITLS